MIRLERLTLREIHLPLIEPFRTVRGEVGVRRILLLELVDEGGIGTWSECVAQADAGYSLETVDSCWTEIHDSLAPRMLGKPIKSGGEATALLRPGTEEAPMARAAVEMGIWALLAHASNQSLARFLAAASRASRAQRTHVETAVALGMQPSEEVLVE